MSADHYVCPNQFLAIKPYCCLAAQPRANGGRSSVHSVFVDCVADAGETRMLLAQKLHIFGGLYSKFL